MKNVCVRPQIDMALSSTYCASYGFRPHKNLLVQAAWFGSTQPWHDWIIGLHTEIERFPHKRFKIGLVFKNQISLSNT